MEEKRLAVEIFGERIFLLSSEEEAYLKSLAAYVDAKMIEIFKFRRAQGEKPIINSMLLGLNIADELFKEKRKHAGSPPDEANKETRQKEARDREMAALKGELENVKAKNRKLYEDNSQLKHTLDKKTKELAALQKEFNDYIETFDVGSNL